MAYRIFAFDGLQLSEYLQDGDDQNMGTGSALSAYMQIPGGFFNHYSGFRAPQGIRPITKKCLIVGDTDDDVKNQISAIRAKIGVEGKLTIEWNNAELWWQWATLKNVDTPQTFDFRGSKVCPMSLSFETAAQLWFKVVVSPVEWTWGDSTWTFGDGTAEIGESGTLAALTETTGGLGQNFTINHGGNIDAENVAVTITAGTSSITAWRYINGTRTEQMGGSQTIAPGESLIVNGGDRSVWLRGVPLSISFYINSTGATTSVTTTSAHGLTTGDNVLLSNTGMVDGIVKSVTVSSTTAFNFPSTKYTNFVFSTGNVRKLTSYYSNWKDSFASLWPVLSPGNNTIALVVTGNATADATIAWEFYEHFA